jgi:hypothetical protein
MDALKRGDRGVFRIDFATADWRRNEYGVDVLTLSQDAVSGAVSFALRTPPGLVYPERQHFYDCDEELFQFEGEFHHDLLLPYRSGDYVFRPAGTVYGEIEGSDGGLIIASFARESVRYHFDDHPQPWRGHYRVDKRWNPHRTDPFIVRSDALGWRPAAFAPDVEVKPLRGNPGEPSPTDGPSEHSPWAADAAFIMRVKTGSRDEFPQPGGAIFEALVLDGRAEIGGAQWHRGCYSFGGLRGPCRIDADLVLYVRSFQGRG